MKNPRNDAWQIVNENLKGYYPNWSSNAVQIVTSSLFRRFKDLVNQDTFAVVDIVSEGVLILNKRHSSGIILSNYWLNPGFHMELAKVYDKQKGGLNSVEEGYFNQIIQEENINPNENYKNISLYADEIIKKETLTTKESELFLLMIEISLAELEGEFYKNLNKVAVELGLTEKDTNFRKAYQRLREKLLNSDNKGSLDLLTGFIVDNKKDSVIADFFKYVDSQFIITNHLQAYRFSEQEMTKMIELKKIFEKNCYKINRFPKVYIDEEYVLDEKDMSNLNIDKLGCYRFKVNNDNSTEEGVIIIYTKAIEMYCNAISHKIYSINLVQLIDCVTLIVLMHELGHWLSHWPKCFDKNWEKGYGEDNLMTHESLAQLIAYWAIKKKDSDIKSILENYLTPNDSNNPYALYKKLINYGQKEILMRLVNIRENNKSDIENFEVLSSPNKYKYTKLYKGRRAGIDYGI